MHADMECRVHFGYYLYMGPPPDGGSKAGAELFLHHHTHQLLWSTHISDYSQSSVMPILKSAEHDIEDVQAVLLIHLHRFRHERLEVEDLL